MNPLRAALAAAGVFAVMASAAFADDNAVAARARVIPRSANAADCTTSYSVEVPVVARVQGTAFFRTFIAFTNNTNKNGVTASYQFSYTCVSAGCSPAGGFYRTAVQGLTLQAFDSIVFDDFVDTLNTAGLLQPGAEQGTIGTLLVTFDNLPSCSGWEANVIARTYNRIVEADATQGTVGFAYNASLFFESAHTTLVGFARDTKSSPTVAGKLRTNVGIRNTDINSTNRNVTVDITFYDTKTGQLVGSTQTFQDLRPGELRQISDIWATAGIPSTVNSIIVFADARNSSSSTPTIEGYMNIVEGFNTQDAAFFEMKCGDGPNLCGQ